MQIPIVADVTKEIAARYGVLKKDAGIALRGLYIINPQVRSEGGGHCMWRPWQCASPALSWALKVAQAGQSKWLKLTSPSPPRFPTQGVVEHATINNFPIGRNVDEALRTLQAVQYVAEHGEAGDTPAAVESPSPSWYTPCLTRVHLHLSESPALPYPTAGEVCPAGWKPGDKTMVADAEKSLEYFESLTEAGGAEVRGQGKSIWSSLRRRCCAATGAEVGLPTRTGN